MNINSISKLEGKDYHPFGMVEPARQFTAATSTGYRFGFNGKEKSDEMEGSGVDYDYGARIYDARIGRWLTVDNSRKEYVNPYQFASGNPLNFIDPDGNTEFHFSKTTECYFQGSLQINLKTVMSLTIVTAEGPDRFFYKEVENVMKPVYPTIPPNYNGWYNTTGAKPVGYEFDHAKTVNDVPFFPWNKDSHSNVTINEWMAWPVNLFYKPSDDDFTSLEKLMYSDPELVNYILKRGMTGVAADNNGWNNALNHYKLDGALEETHSILNNLNAIGISSIGGEIISAVGTKMASGFGDLTIGEVNQIQSVVNETGQSVDVVGSAARGGRKAGSDIDYVVSAENKGVYKNVQNKLPKLDQSHGVIVGSHNPAAGPAIRFTPGSIEPTNIPGAINKPISHNK